MCATLPYRLIGKDVQELFQVVYVPKSSVFSVRNCSRSRDILAGKVDPALELSLAFLLET